MGHPAVHYFFSDYLGSTRVLTDSTGSPAQKIDYYPFGGATLLLNTTPNQYQFIGHERDSETGLDYYRYRMLSASLGRWTTPDPIHLPSPGYPQMLDRYSYVSNNPTNLVDPDGTCGRCPGDERCEREDWPIGQRRGPTVCVVGNDSNSGNPRPCAPIFSSFRVIANCDGKTINKSRLQIGGIDKERVADSEVISVSTDNVLFIELVGTYYSNVITAHTYYQDFLAYKPKPGAGQFSTQGNIIWKLRYSCYGGPSNVTKTFAQGVTCAN